MTRKSLGDHLIDYYSETTLRASTVERLERMAETVEFRPPRRRRVLFVPILVSVLTVLLVLLLVRGSPPLLRDADLTREIAQEIVTNYEKNLGPEILTDDFGHLSAMADHLGFVPSEPARLADRGFRLLGARYCSVQRHVAAQIILTDRDRRRVMLYQLTDAADLPEFKTTVVPLDEVEVTMWREDSFFYGLVMPAE